MKPVIEHAIPNVDGAEVFNLEVDGKVVGAVGASGGNGSQDEEMARTAAASLSNKSGDVQ